MYMHARCCPGGAAGDFSVPSRRQWFWIGAFDDDGPIEERL